MKIRLEDGTGLDLKYLVKDTDRHGTVRVYVRRHGRKVRIRELGTVEEFMVGTWSRVLRVPYTARSCARRITLRTVVGGHCPPRAVLTPRAFNASAIRCNDVAPLARASLMIGRTFAANWSASIAAT